MEITFLGTSHGIAEPHHFCSSAVVTVGGKHYVIDAGAPMTTLLQTYGFNFHDIQGIFITHSHQDHTLGLVDLLSQIYGFPGRWKDLSIPVFVPDDDFYHRMFTFLFGAPDFYGALAFSVYPDGVIFDDGNLRVTAIPVEHMPNAHAFLLEGDGKRVLFTGDLRGDLADCPAVLFDDSPLDLCVFDGAHTVLTEPRNVALLSRFKVSHLIVSHRNLVRNPDERMEELAASLSAFYPVSIAFDGRRVEL